MNQAIIGQSPAPPYAMRSRRGFAEFFVYPVPSQGLNPRTLRFTEEFDRVDFDGDADFELQRLSAFSSLFDETPTQYDSFYPQVNFNIRDNATGRLLFGDYMSMSEIFGIGRTPFVLPTTHFFRRATSAQIIYSPIDPGPGFDNSNISLLLIGRKHLDY